MSQTLIHPQDIGKALNNPGMGWVYHYYDNSITNYGSRLEPWDTVEEFPGLTVLYLRLAWAYLEPEEGKYNWSIIDAPAQRWIDQGRQVAYRITTSESGMAFATPEWVKKAGAQGFYFEYGKGVVEKGKCWEPDFNDPIYLKKLENFLAVFAARYDGDPHVDFIDVGTLGVWGEGHTFGSTLIKYSPESIIRHIDLHRKYFKKTLLVSNDDFDGPEDPGPHYPTIEYSLAHGITLRDDSILVQKPPKSYFHANMAQLFWPKLPVILESEHYGMSRDRGAWGDGSFYLKAVEDYHASYASIHWWPREFLNENRELIDKMNLRLGYRIQLTEAGWQQDVKADTKLDIAYTLRNAGVAPCYGGGHPIFTLKDTKNGIAGVWIDDTLDVCALPVAAPGQAKATKKAFTVKLTDKVKPGEYTLYFSVGTKLGTATIELPMENGDGKRRYKLGAVKVD